MIFVLTTHSLFDSAPINGKEKKSYYTILIKEDNVFSTCVLK